MTGGSGKTVESSEAYIVHQRPYRETSTIVDAFTEMYGRMSFVVKGAKSKSGKHNKWHALQPFSKVILSWVGRSDLKTLTGCESLTNQRLLGVALYSGLYLNEIIYHLLKPYDAAPQLFSDYHDCIEQLNQQPIEPLLRQFEIQLLQEVGFGIDFQTDTSGQELIEEQHYEYIAQHGFVIQNKGIQGKQLLAIARGEWDNSEALQNAKRLLRPLIDQLLSGKELKSRQYFRKPS